MEGAFDDNPLMCDICHQVKRTRTTLCCERMLCKYCLSQWRKTLCMYCASPSMRTIENKPVRRILEATYQPCYDKNCDMWLLPSDRLSHWATNHGPVKEKSENDTLKGVYCGVVPLKKYCGRGILLCHQKRIQNNL